MLFSVAQFVLGFVVLAFAPAEVRVLGVALLALGVVVLARALRAAR